LYFADALWLSTTPLGPSVWLQLLVFAAVALGSAILGAQLRQQGVGREMLQAELVQVRLQADTILQNIRSGVLTVDGGGNLLYVNPTAEQLLGLQLAPSIGRPVLDDISSAAPDLARAVERSVKFRVRTTRAEAVVLSGGKQFPIGLTTTYTE